MAFKQMIDQKLQILENLITKAEAEERGLNDDEQVLYDETEAEVKNLQKAQKQKEDLIAKKELLKKAVTPVPANIIVGSDRAVDKPWDNFGDFLNAVCKVSDPSNSVIDNRLMQGLPTNSSGMQVAVGSDGGFMVGTQFMGAIMDSIMGDSVVLPRITRIPISAGNNGIALPVLAETSRADGSRWGGIRAYWVNEGTAGTKSKPDFGELTLKLSKLLAFVYATDELIRDSAAMESWIMDKLPKEIAFKVDDAIINGSGNGIPLGILNGGGLVSVAKETSQVADTVMYENVLKMWGRCPPRARINAVWLINQEVEAQLAQMSIKIKNVAGGENVGGAVVYLPAGGAANSPYSTLFGKPVLVVEQCQPLGDVGDIIVADLSDYIGIDKDGIRADTSIHVQFLYDEQLFRFRYRFNGAPYTSNTVASFANSNFTVSPYVALAARA